MIELKDKYSNYLSPR